MLRVVPHKSAAAALAYYTQGLRREDYYSEGQEVAGKWYGKAALRLGLVGSVTPEAFAALVNNRHPETGKQLTPRMKADRVVGADFNFNAPKSLSLLHAITGDERIANVFRAAVAETMADIELLAETRVRKRGAQENRFTKNLAWAEFLHLTGRPVDGKPDPQLHVHAYVFNTTFDEQENRWKAAKFRNLKANSPYMEAAFHARLAAAVAALGYPVERMPDGWRITGMSKAMTDRFSRRTEQIESLARKRGITDAKAKDALGAKSREKKLSGVPYSTLVAEWKSRLSAAEIEFIRGLGRRGGTTPANRIQASREAMDFAVEKLFEKNSVVSVNRLMREACRFGVGRVVPDDVWREFTQRKMIVRDIGGEDYCTTVNVLAEEVALINFVRSGRGRYAPLAPDGIKNLPRSLSMEQLAAGRHVLESRDQVIAIRGRAGTGKTTLMKEVVAAIERQGLKVYAFAPSATASRETLREAGFANAETIAHLLNNPRLQKEIRGHVVWIDEVGQVGVRDLWQIMRLLGNDTHAIVTGDTGQHAPVARGDGFRLLQDFAGLKIAELTEIRRQELPAYKEAVAALSNGDLRTAFRRLDSLGAIVEIENDAERYMALAEDYVASGRSGTLPLVVSPTHAEAAKVTEAIREARREAGELYDTRSFIRYHDLKWEVAERKRGENYSAGHVVQFHQNAKGVRRGEIFHVTGRDDKGRVMVTAETGRKTVLSLSDAPRFTVYEQRPIEVSRGERIRITRNGETADGRRINNGNVFTVKSFTPEGNILLTTGGVLDARHGHFRHGYCETSHSSQSKTVRDVIIAQGADSFIASTREQFYVSASRGKASIRIYTDDRKALQEAVGNSSQRRSGVELAGLGPKEISSFMEAGLTGDQWRAQIRSRAENGKAVNFVENVMKQRGANELRKPEGVTFQQYVEARRKNVSADGKNRSKGHPKPLNPKPQGKQFGKRSFIRPTSPPTPAKTAGQQPAPKPPTPSRFVRAAKSLQNSIKNLKGVLSRHGTLSKAKPPGLPKGTVQTAAKQRVNQRATDKQRKAEIKTAIKKMTQKPPTPPPTIRRGK